MPKKTNRLDPTGWSASDRMGTGKASGPAGYFGSVREMQKMDAAGEAVAESLGAATIENKYNSSM